MLSSLNLSLAGEKASFPSRLKSTGTADDWSDPVSAIHGLSPDERKYFGVPDERPVMTVIRSYEPKSLQSKTQQEDKRRAKRKKERQRLDGLVAEQELQLKAARAEKRAENQRIKAEMKLSRLRAKEERQNRSPKQVTTFDESEELEFKLQEPKSFVPQIGKPNIDGETPVKIDAKTTILVKPGKDIYKTINRYQKALNLTITIWEM